MNEQVDFYSKLFQSEGGDENSAHELTRHIVNKLDNNEKETGKKFWGIILNKTRITIGHQHGRWLSAEVSTSVQLRM
jgi:hypothetical protein